MADQMAKELTDDTTVIEVKSLIYHRVGCNASQLSDFDFAFLKR